MNKPSATSVLAAFATLKNLNDAKEYSNSYQVLAEFINYIIGTQNLYSFTSIEMKNRLNSIFGFEIPEAVVKTASKSLPYITRANGIYTVDKKVFSFDTSFNETKEAAEKTNLGLVDLLYEYIKERAPERHVSLDVLTQDFIAFLVDDQQKTSGQYIDLISEFVLKNEGNSDVQASLNAIREGSILYIGLNHNINETGSLTKNLTLFLGTEVLFGLVGYNGEIHKQLAQDFWAQIRSANTNGPKIKLRYFSDVEKEIDSFFNSAESILEGRVQPFDTVAMKAILNSCDSASDVAVKKADFYHTLQYSYGIIKDDKDDYYSEENHKYNLESMEHTDAQLQESWKYISHINKLRKGTVYQNNVESEYLVVTNTRCTLLASKEQTEKNKEEKSLEHANDYALSLDRITNTLWYKLGNGFGKKAYPSNVSMVLKARIVLASSVSRNIAEVYSKAKEEHRNGEISDDQLAARIVTLRKKPILPEELEGDLIEDIMDFSPEFLSRYEEEVNANKIALQEKELEIKRIEEENQLKLKKRDDTIAEKDELIRQQNIDKGKLESELAQYREKEAKKANRKTKIKKVIRFIISLAWKLGIIALIAGVALFCEKRFESNIPVFICGAIDLVGIFHFCRTSIKNDYSKIFSKDSAQ